MGQRLGRWQQVLLKGWPSISPSSPSVRRSNDTWDDNPAGRRPKPLGELRNYLGGLAKDSDLLVVSLVGEPLKPRVLIVSHALLFSLRESAHPEEATDHGL